MDNHHDSSPDRANGDEPILIFAVLFIVDHQVVLVTLEEGSNLIEADTVLPLVLALLRWIPLYPHLPIVRH